MNSKTVVSATYCMRQFFNNSLKQQLQNNKPAISVLPFKTSHRSQRCAHLTSQRCAHTQAAPEPLTLTTQTENGIRTICLNNPKQRNAMSLQMLTALYEDLTRDPEEVRVIILKAKGPVFSSGHNLKELVGLENKAFHEKVFSMCTIVMNVIQDLPVPVISQVYGLATAAGCQLVATSDIAVVSENSSFGTPGVSVGLFCTTPGVALGRSVPRKVAMEMLFTGRPISAQDALLHGLVSKVVPDDDVEAETMKIAQRITETSRDVIALGKASFYTQMALEKKSAYRFAEKVMVENIGMADGQEGIAAFVQKRKPNWTKK